MCLSPGSGSGNTAAQNAVEGSVWVPVSAASPNDTMCYLPHSELSLRINY